MLSYPGRGCFGAVPGDGIVVSPTPPIIETLEHELPKPEADLPTAPASDLPTPSTIAEVESSKNAEIWRGSRAREFNGLLQAHTFGPA